MSTSLPSFRALALIFALVPTLAAAQVELPQPASPPPPPPPAGWHGAIGAGMALTSGNSDTSTINMAYDLHSDLGSEIVFKSTGLYLRSTSEGDATVDRAALDGRVDYRLAPRLSAFGQTQYARDRFKEIDYLIAPTVGLSYSILPPDGRAEWVADGSVGFLIEKNTGFDATTSGAVSAAERFVYKLTNVTRFTHAATGLWKMEDFGDGFYTLSAGVSTSLASMLELKAEFLNTYKREPTDPTLKKNDQAVVLSVVYKF